jgi:hypothetical protein
MRWLGLLGFLALLSACGGAGEKTATPPVDAQADVPPPPPPDAGVKDAEVDAEPVPSPEFAALYRDVFSIFGSAKCQHPSCHGGDRGNSGLVMGAKATDVYAALTTYRYEGRLLVAADPAGGDVRAASALLDVLDLEAGVMPRVEPAVGNRGLTQAEFGLIDRWLSTGGKF